MRRPVGWGAGLGLALLTVIAARGPGVGLVAAPLSDAPLLAAASRDFPADTSPGTLHDGALLAEAVRRNPRDGAARLLLMRQAGARGDLAGALAQLAALRRFDAAAADRVLTGLGRGLASTALVDTTAAALAGQGELWLPILRGFAGGGHAPQVRLRLVGWLPKAVLTDREARGLAVGQLAAAGDFARARGLAGASGWVDSPDFAPSPVPAPFGWDLADGAIGSATRGPGGGLAVAFYGRESGVLVRQTLALAPGAYRARLDWREGSGADAAALALAVACADGGAVLAQAPVAAPGLVLEFAVPAAGCDGQVLSLTGRGGAGLAERDGTLRRIDVKPAR